MELCEVLSRRRKQINITIDDLVSRSGIAKGTLNKILNGVTKDPQLETTKAIVYALGLTLEDLDTKPSVKEKIDFAEKGLLCKYRALDTHGKKIVDLVLNEEHDRCSMPTPVARPLPINVIKMQVYDDPAAADIPIYAESACEYMDFPEDDVPSGADFGIRISGDSMEPTVRDGQIVWIKSQPELYAGQVGVFMLDGGEAVCKRARVRDDGRVFALESDNPKYAPIEGSDLEGLRVVGRVLL